MTPEANPLVKGKAQSDGERSTADGFFIGFDSQAAESAPIVLKPRTLLRHMMAIGSTGSGKTVACKNVVEEFVRHGVPAICLDPQGDLCSLALAADDPDLLRRKGVDPALAAAFAEKADVVVFTPASRKGIGVSVDPVQGDIAGLSPRDRVHAVTSTATMIVSLLGYDLDSDDGEGLVAVFDRVLTERLEAGRFPASLDVLSEYLMGMAPEQREPYTRYLAGNKIEQALRRLARLDVGARRLLFHEGLPLSIDLLLGIGERGGAIPGKTRVSVIYLNTLHSQEDKEFFVAAVVEQLYRWMLRNPSDDPQALFYVDEVAPYIPPVRKPASKPALSLLFKQARKYGISCLAATQNPGDVDYKAMAQFGTWGIGRLTTRQDMKKVRPTVKSLDPVHVDAIMETLPGQKPGRFVLISPDNFERSQRLKVRWLYTRHETLDEERIEALADSRWRTRFDALEDSLSEQAGGRMPEEGPAPPAPPVVAEDQSPAPLAEGERADRTAGEPGPTGITERLPAELQDALGVLVRHPSMSTREFVRRHKVSEGRARGLIGRLMELGLVERYRAGRSYQYWSRDSGFRPDLGLRSEVEAFVPRIHREQAEAIGHRLRDQKLLGLIGDEEEVAGASLEYRLAIRVSFQEKVKRSFWKRLVGLRAHERRVENVYLHPRSLKFVVLVPGQGITLHERPKDHASEIRDFDGVALHEKRLPGELALDEREWAARPKDDLVRQRLAQAYPARVQQVGEVLVPVWRVLMKQPDRPGHRVLLIDALDGQPMEW